jgi:hypothetical protein
MTEDIYQMITEYFRSVGCDVTVNLRNILNRKSFQVLELKIKNQFQILLYVHG